MDNDSRSPPSDIGEATSILPTITTTTTTTTEDTYSSRRSLGGPEWTTADGPLGLSHEDSLPYARRFFKLGFFCLPFLWAVNCFYFWPVLRNPHSHRSHPGLLRLEGIRKQNEQRRIFEYLAGLRSEYELQRVQVLGKDT